VYNKKVFRATNDIDFGVNVKDWEVFNNLISLLTQENNFVRDKNIEHRLLFNEVYPVDIVPFGNIASKEGIFKWPNENKEFTVLGFEEAYKNSDLVKVRNSPEVTVNLAAAHSLAVLKIISWNERYPERLRDASDLLLIIESYLEAGNQERLYEEEEDIVNDNFDFAIAGARLLGRDIAEIFNNKTLIFVLNILENETGEKQKYRLIEDMLKTRTMNEDSEFEYYLKILDSLKSGIQERFKK
jgi:predicted nucleotidyltransferase